MINTFGARSSSEVVNNRPRLSGIDIASKYPYTPDGARRWDFSAAWPDPWVLIGALAAVTTRLHFFTSVYVPSIKYPGVTDVLNGEISDSPGAMA